MHHHQKKPSMFKFHETSHPLRNGDQNFMGCKVKFRLIVINSWDDHGHTMVYKHEVFVVTLSPLKIPTWFTFFRRERLKKSVTWQRQPMGGDGETIVLHTQTPREVFKHQRLVKKRMQHNAAETHISHTKQVSNNVAMYHHYRCYNCDIMIASHLKHQRHVDVENPPLSRPSSHLTVPHLQPSAKSPRNLSTWQQDLTVLFVTLRVSHLPRIRLVGLQPQLDVS